MRSAKRGLYTSEEVAFLRRLAPHLSRALQVDQALATSQIKHVGLEALLDHSTTATVLLDGRGRILYTNAAADRLLAGGEGLWVRNSRLAVAHQDSHTALYQAVAAAVSIYRGLEVAVSVTILLQRPTGKRPYTALVAPYSPASARFIESSLRPAVMIFLTDLEAIPRLPADILRALYGLTRSEARLTILLAEAQTLSEAAKTLHISLNTAKTHLKAVYAKMGTRRQAELVRLCLALLKGVALPRDGTPDRRRPGGTSRPKAA